MFIDPMRELTDKLYTGVMNSNVRIRRKREDRLEDLGNHHLFCTVIKHFWVDIKVRPSRKHTGQLDSRLRSLQTDLLLWGPRSPLSGYCSAEKRDARNIQCFLPRRQRREPTRKLATGSRWSRRFSPTVYPAKADFIEKKNKVVVFLPGLY